MVDHNNNHDFNEMVEEGVKFTAGLVTTAALAWTAKIRFDQKKDLDKAANWQDYTPPVADAFISPFFINGKLSTGELFSSRIKGYSDGKALKLVQTALYKALKETSGNKHYLVALATAVSLLMDYKGITPAVRTCQKGEQTVIKDACFILAGKDTKKGKTNEETLINAVASMYPQFAEFLA